MPAAARPAIAATLVGFASIGLRNARSRWARREPD
jgi:hypothetical protein